jgi:CubicO group peptidase (beta-lactamase class C family)
MATILAIDEARQDEWWPAASWAMIDDIAAAGWSLERLHDAFHYAGTIATDAVMIVQGGREVASRGDITRRFHCHSVRKSFLSALMGPYVEDGTIDLSLTLAALGIDDVEELSPKEKQATPSIATTKMASGLDAATVCRSSPSCTVLPNPEYRSTKRFDPST